jgi:putative flippase GtrA
VDSVNSLYDTLSEFLVGDFSVFGNEERKSTLLILFVFTAGSAVGLVTLSHLLGYVLKHFKSITTAVIIGFITGSLGVVWPWKKTIFMLDEAGNHLLDSNGNEIIVNYSRYLPDMGTAETWWALGYILLGIVLLVALEWYGKYRLKDA